MYEFTKTAPNEGSFLGKISFYDDMNDGKKNFISSNLTDRHYGSKKRNYDTKEKPSNFEYHMEEDELTYRSSLHSVHQQ